MKGVYRFGAAVVAVVLLSVEVAASVAAGSTGTVVKTTCKLSLTDEIPAGATTVTPASEQGTQFGSAQCHKLLGSGVQADTFTLMPSGNVQGKYKQYFNQGSIEGSYTLTPGDAPPTSQTTFTNEHYTGKTQISNGTGAYQGAKGKGTVTCSTTDDVHFACTEKIKLTHT